MRIGDKTVGAGAPAYIAAEMAWSHDGSLDRANIIIDGAAAASADAINFHVTHLPAYMVPFYGAGPERVSGGRDVHDVYRYLESINANFDMIQAMVQRAKNKGMAVSCMVNDPESCRFIQQKIDADFLMVHPSSIFDEAFVRQIAQLGKPLVLYTGGLTLGEIEKAVDWARSEGNADLILQHGFQSYPTPIEFNRLQFIPTLKRLFGLPVAFADHTDGDDPMALVVPLLAVAIGADMVEKHITHDRAAKSEDYEAALDPAGFATLVERIRMTETAMGTGAWHGLSDREKRYRGVVRKRAVAGTRLPAGEVLQRSHVAYKRADSGLYPEEIVLLLEKVRLTKDVEENAPLDWRYFAPLETELP